MKNFNDILWPDTPFDLEPSLALVARRGSESHGTYIPPEDSLGVDDRDIFGIVLPPAEYYLGLKKWQGEDEIKGVWDVVLYEFRKMVSLLMKQNPNVIGMLWLEDEDYLYISQAGQRLIDSRDLFRSRTRAYSSFCGYASSQLRKMENCAKNGFMGAKRKELVDRFGFDPKNASHLIRLLHMGVEYLETGVMNVRRTWDRDQLIAIKKGEVSLESIKSEADEWFERARIACDNSALPEEIDFDAVNDLITDILYDHILYDRCMQR